MKDLSLIAYITQLGMSIAAPLTGFTLFGVWLRNRLELGAWVIAVFCAVGLISGIHGFIMELKILEKRESKKDKPVPRSFNGHS